MDDAILEAEMYAVEQALDLAHETVDGRAVLLSKANRVRGCPRGASRVRRDHP